MIPAVFREIFNNVPSSVAVIVLRVERLSASAHAHLDNAMWDRESTVPVFTVNTSAFTEPGFDVDGRCTAERAACRFSYFDTVRSTLGRLLDARLIAERTTDFPGQV